MSTNALEMSDEDFLNAPIGMPDETEAETKEEEETEIETSVENSEEVAEAESEAQEDDEDEAEENITAEDLENIEEKEELASEVESKDTSTKEDVFDAKGEDAQKVFQPFKANGKDVQVKNADEAIQLMQMGANYTQKMQALQPNLKIMKMLEQQDLLSEEKLNFLIDLSKNDPKAIAKLVKDAEIDPMQLEPTEEGEEYVPQNYSVPDEAIHLEQVLSEIENTPTYAKCIDIVGNQWDNSSKEVLSQTPIMIKQLNEQMQSGIFDQITSEVDRLKMFGGLSGLSDLEAYKQVGLQLSHVGQLAGAKPKPIAETQVENKIKDTARTLKRRAASTPKNSKKSATTKKDFNPLALSDEEFAKLVI